jgi:hypothetical protein
MNFIVAQFFTLAFVVISLGHQILFVILVAQFFTLAFVVISLGHQILFVIHVLSFFLLKLCSTCKNALDMGLKLLGLHM